MYDPNEFIYETETDSQTWNTDLWFPKGKELKDGWIGSLGLLDASYSVSDG